MSGAPSWWTRRERLASAIGPHVWLGWFIAPAASRRRWEAIAEVLGAGLDPDDELEGALDALAEFGYQLVPGPVRRVADYGGPTVPPPWLPWERRKLERGVAGRQGGG